MFVLNTLVQIVAVIAGVYIAFTNSFGKGIQLVIIVFAMNFAFLQLSNFLMWLHQKTMSKEEQQDIVNFMSIGRTDITPTTWTVIANICGFLFFVSASYIIFIHL